MNRPVVFSSSQLTHEVVQLHGFTLKSSHSQCASNVVSSSKFKRLKVPHFQIFTIEARTEQQSHYFKKNKNKAVFIPLFTALLFPANTDTQYYLLHVWK